MSPAALRGNPGSGTRGARRGRLWRLHDRVGRRASPRREIDDLSALGRQACADRGCIPHLPSRARPRHRERNTAPAGGAHRPACRRGRGRLDLLGVHSRAHRCGRARPGSPAVSSPVSAGGPSTSHRRDCGGGRAGGFPGSPGSRARGRGAAWRHLLPPPDVERAARPCPGGRARRVRARRAPDIAGWIVGRYRRYSRGGKGTNRP
jgi:hypothetical protein